ncbi:TIGR03619 family F420-dependent LLM class oxidoreductase [Skermania piniformis]|uniref:TIGR03619 family F420-dependent LLM class oxidoreductase n=1 Tax=Skermania pinensis TaxID=39122 RepID=A0ABX8S8W3_9ACTN|nr:TIGR03619 family F420-dependent LLM class oxidoreductase [Skermania piniformis]QXQ12945.1 TIGR03619 family F420-dependent LLM class oxidoreductase [Skermania piniformis]
MRYVLEYPSEQSAASDDFLRPEVIREVSCRAEEIGCAAIALSEHPAPSVKWRRAGGHETLDPIAVLGFVAGVTTRLRLLTNLYVLPFRNPYLSAKALGTIDIVSGGRLIAGVGAGYLRSEFAALGVDHERRAALFDEALAALQAIWIEPAAPVSGVGFAAPGRVWLRRPVQQPHPPIWIGGNGAAAIRRVTEYGAGWMPIIADTRLAATMRTAALESAEQFGAAVDRLRTRLEAAGRDPSAVEIQVVCPHFAFADTGSVRTARAILADLANRGATTALIHADAANPAATAAFLDRFGEAFL